MKLSVVLASCLAGLSAAIAIPKGTSIATIQIPNQNDLRVYYQDNNNYIVESSVGLPTNKAIGAYIIYTGGPRKRTPLASLSYNNSGRVEIRVYFITSANTLGEIAYSDDKWNGGYDLGIPVQSDTQALYALRVSTVLIVGYTNKDGQLSEAYYDTAIGQGWKTYVL